MLADRITTHQPQVHDPEPEDIFSSCLGTVFPDDTQNAHGGPSGCLTYASPRYGQIKLRIADPQGEDARRLFAHYLWDAGLFIADAIEGASGAEKQEKDGASSPWDARGERVLELGAGVGLSGIVCGMAGAAEIVLTDYPAPEVIANIRHNVQTNSMVSSGHKVAVKPHTWGHLDDAFSMNNIHHFTRIIAADDLWMMGEHANLAKSMAHFLSNEPSACVLVVAGFHTGRAKVAAFFDVVSTFGLAVEKIEEVDVNGVRRAWVKTRDAERENVTERKRWLVVAVLKPAPPVQDTQDSATS